MENRFSWQKESFDIAPKVRLRAQALVYLYLAPARPLIFTHHLKIALVLCRCSDWSRQKFSCAVGEAIPPGLLMNSRITWGLSKTLYFHFMFTRLFSTCLAFLKLALLFLLFSFACFSLKPSHGSTVPPSENSKLPNTRWCCMYLNMAQSENPNETSNTDICI